MDNTTSNNIIFIYFSVHYIYNYFKNNLTVPKIKDLIKKPVKQYEQIYEAADEKVVDNEVMKNELKDYLKNLSEKSTETKLENVGNVFSDNTTGSFTSY